jgi:hypothetical protein
MTTKGEVVTKVDIQDAFREIAKTITIPEHGSCGPSLPKEVVVEKTGIFFRAATTCDQCHKRFVTFPFRDTWY